MTGSELRYAKRERLERWKIAGWVAGAFVAVLLLGGMGAVLQQVSAQTANTAMAVQQTKKVVEGHNTELARIEALAAATRQQQQSDSTDRTQLNTDVEQVASYATQLADEVTANHAQATSGQLAICATLNQVVKDLGIKTACTIPGT